jgi:uncharacterized membrane protein
MKVTERSVVPDKSSERVDWSWHRNVIQLIFGLTAASAGATIGFFVSPAPRALGALAGFVVGGVAGVFLVGVVLAFVPKNATVRSVAKIASRYRSARRQLLICLAMIPVLATLFPILNIIDSAAVWMIWVVAIGILYVNVQLVYHQLTHWQCPQCQHTYGYPGVIRDLWRGGKFDCVSCDYSMFQDATGPPSMNAR